MNTDALKINALRFLELSIIALEAKAVTMRKEIEEKRIHLSDLEDDLKQKERLRNRVLSSEASNDLLEVLSNRLRMEYPNACSVSPDQLSAVISENNSPELKKAAQNLLKAQADFLELLKP